MKVDYTQAGTYTITGITPTQYNALRSVLQSADDRCFEVQNKDGSYYSNDDFVCMLDAEEREALAEVCNAL